MTEMNRMPIPESVNMAPLNEVPVEKEESKKKRMKRENSTEVKSSALGPLQVVATRPGFFGGFRYAEGDKFTIENMAQFSDESKGGWMKQI
jgi:hypothetical protein